MIRYSIFFLAFFILIAPAMGQPGSAANAEVGNHIVFRCGAPAGSDNQHPLFIIDGVPCGLEDVSKLDPHRIDSVFVLRQNDAVLFCDRKPKNGVIIITTRPMRKVVTVIDALDRSPLAGATVSFTSGNDSLVIAADDHGLAIPGTLRKDREYRVRVTSVGYIPYSTLVRPDTMTNLVVGLYPDIEAGPEVVVTAHGTIRCSRVISCFLTRISDCDLVTMDHGTLHSPGNSFAETTPIQIFPNPVRGGAAVSIGVKSSSGRPLRVSLLTMDGRNVFSRTRPAVKGLNLFQVPTQDRWAKGIYILQVCDSGGKELGVGRILIQ